MDVRFCESRSHRREAHVRAVGADDGSRGGASEAHVRRIVFPLDKDWVENHVLMLGFREVRLGNQAF
jgi:hypothetical protein